MGFTRVSLFFCCKLFFFISYSVNKLPEIASLRLNNVLLNFATYHVDELDGNKSLTLSGSFNFHWNCKQASASNNISRLSRSATENKMSEKLLCMLYTSLESDVRERIVRGETHVCVRITFMLYNPREEKVIISIWRPSTHQNLPIGVQTFFSRLSRRHLFFHFLRLTFSSYVAW